SGTRQGEREHGGGHHRARVPRLPVRADGGRARAPPPARHASYRGGDADHRPCLQHHAEPAASAAPRTARRAAHPATPAGPPPRGRPRPHPRPPPRGRAVLGRPEGPPGSTPPAARSLSSGWNRNKHAALAPGTSAILAPDCYRCPVASTFPGCDFLCLKTSLTLADANFTARPAAVIVEPVLSAGGGIVPPPGDFAALRGARAA